MDIKATGQMAQPVQARKDFRAGLAVSMVIHLVLLASLLRFAPAAVEEAPEPVISVRMVPLSIAPENQNTPQPPAADNPSERQAAPPAEQQDEGATPLPAPGPPPALEAAPKPETLQAEPQKADTAPQMKDASSFYAAALLSRPENRSARDALKTLSPAERNEQICGTEAMEQIRRADAKLRPDRLIAYALENTQVDGDRLHAPGAAFRSAHRWFRVTFDCTLDAGHGAVAAFRFAIGAPIPTSRWAELQLER